MVTRRVREERAKLKLRLVVTTRFQWGFESLPRHIRPGWPNRQRQTAINLRLLLQTQHSPPIAGSTGHGLGRQVQVRILPGALPAPVVQRQNRTTSS
jgi:hypothetical protein